MNLCQFCSKGNSRAKLFAGWFVLTALWAVISQGQFDSSSRVNSVYPDISIEAATHLRTAASYAADQNWTEAADLYQKLIEKFGNKVVQVGTRNRYITVRDYCHIQLAAMPSRAIEQYRHRIDAQAEAWFKAGLRDRDRDQLMRVVDEAFVSSWGDDALDALAEIAFESGDFDQAWMAWRMIYLPGADETEHAPAAEGRLIYPDTNLDRALVEAKQLLCQLFSARRGNLDQAIADYRRRYPTARGALGGSTGLLADRIVDIARDAAKARASVDANWITFGGNPQRNKVMPEAIDIGSIQWEAKLPQVVQPRIGVGSRPLINNTEDMLSYHPLVVRDQVIVSGRDEVFAYDLHEGPKNGQPLWNFRLRDQGGTQTVMAVRPSAGSPQYTLTAHRGRLYVRMGSPETTLPIRRGGQPDSYLVCLDLTADGKEIWRIQPEPSEPDLAFEGSPVVDDGNVYVGVTRGGAMTHSFLACYDAQTGTKKWRTLICESSSTTSFFNAGSISHNLPTLGGGMVFYNTNLGAVAALDQRTGRVRWIATYGRKGRDEATLRPSPAPSGRELSPCIYHEGVVFALPSDGEGVHAFDASTGELRWRTHEPPMLSHMLGVANGSLICTGNQVVAMDVHTGEGRWQWSDNATITANGRGVLAGDCVYFPTKTKVYVLDQRTGVLAKRKEVGEIQEKHNYSPGNLVIGDGYLVLAQPSKLVVFCQYEVLISRYRELIAQNPSDPEPHLRLARAAEANDAIELAVEHYRATIELTSADGSEEERAMRQTARMQLYSMLQQLAEKTAATSDWSRADGHWREAAIIAPTLQSKLNVMLQRAAMWVQANDGSRAVAIYQDILADDTLRGLGIALEGNRTVRVDVEVADRIDGVLDRFGRTVYARYESAAVDLLSDAQRNDSLASSERLLRTHPNSEAAVQALLYLADRYAEKNQITSATALYKQVLNRTHRSENDTIAAMHGLAQLEESRRHWQAARKWWQRLAQEFPNSLAPNRPEQSVASYVQERLQGAVYEKSTASVEDRLELPLTRRWNRVFDENHRIVIPRGTAPTELGTVLLIGNPQSVECVSTHQSASLWTVGISGPIRWAAFNEDQLLVGTDTELARIATATGEATWRYRSSSDGATFGEFHLIDGRVFLREDAQRVACIDANSGNVLWTYAPTDASIQPRGFFSVNHLALRTKDPSKLVVLSNDGRLRFELHQAGDAWEFPPAAMDVDRLCMATDARTVQLVDLTDGKQVWSYTGPNSELRPVPIAGPNSLVVLVAGHTLVRLDPESGRTFWSVPISDEPLPRYETAWSIDESFFYCITRDLNLRAFRLTDGTVAWEQFLTGPGDQWQLSYSGGHLMALPRSPHPGQGLPVVICRPSDGRLLQRLFFRPHGSEAVVYVSPPHALIGSEREMWLLRKED